MEDRFKFRAKKKDNGEIVYGGFATLPCGISQSRYTDEFSDFGDYIITPKTKQSSYYSNSNPMEVCYCEYHLVDFETLQQCTGLKDKNGKLIYEGDIVNTLKWDKPFSAKGKSKNIKEIVYWDKEYYRFETKEIIPQYEFIYSFGDIRNSEIIGNIYEHKDLLNA